MSVVECRIVADAPEDLARLALQLLTDDAVWSETAAQLLDHARTAWSRTRFDAAVAEALRAVPEGVPSSPE